MLLLPAPRNPGTMSWVTQVTRSGGTANNYTFLPSTGPNSFPNYIKCLSRLLSSCGLWTQDPSQLVPAVGETQNVSPARQAAVYRRGMCQNVCRICVECVLCVFPCVLTRYSFYCDIVICGAIWAAAAPVTGAALSEDTLYSFTLVTCY